jgi:hypothetical protein
MVTKFYYHGLIPEWLHHENTKINRLLKEVNK